jgi:hypothetical protein
VPLKGAPKYAIGFIQGKTHRSFPPRGTLMFARWRHYSAQWIVVHTTDGSADPSRSPFKSSRELGEDHDNLKAKEFQKEMRRAARAKHHLCRLNWNLMDTTAKIGSASHGTHLFFGSSPDTAEIKWPA